MSPFPAQLEKRLLESEVTFLRRNLSYRKGIDFSSNDYLGFSKDPMLIQQVREAIQDFPLGSSGSRLLRGNLDIHEKAEGQLANFVGREAALLFSTGFQANIGFLSAILMPGDFVFSDELNHASLIDGIRLSKATKVVYPHKNMGKLSQFLEETPNREGLKVIVTESLFSMDGDIAPLVELQEIAQHFSAFVVVDEAHATGLYGSFDERLGGGIVQALGLSDSILATIHTGGKALGAQGAWIACDQKMKDYLVNFSRAFIYSTAPMPVVPLSLILAIEYWKEVGKSRAKEVLKQALWLKKQFPELTIGYADEACGPIVPIILGENERALKIGQRIQNEGFDVRTIRPPTVPKGTARLRLTVTWPELSHVESFAKLVSNVIKDFS